MTQLPPQEVLPYPNAPIGVPEEELLEPQPAADDVAGPSNSWISLSLLLFSFYFQILRDLYILFYLFFLNPDKIDTHFCMFMMGFRFMAIIFEFRYIYSSYLSYLRLI